MPKTRQKRTRLSQTTPVDTLEENGHSEAVPPSTKPNMKKKKRKTTVQEDDVVSNQPAQQQQQAKISEETDQKETEANGTVEQFSDYDYIKEHERDQLREEGEIVYGPDGQRYKITLLQGSKKRVPIDRPVRVYADGIYDLFHFGHARSLMQAKNLFPNTHLICGVCGDKLTHKMKGKTVMTEDERVEAVSHCRYVDEIVPHAPWVATIEFCVRHNIDFMCHGQDLTVDENGEDTYRLVKAAGKFLYVERTEGISTSDLILRLIRDYDDYVRRNVSRGYTYRDLNVSLIKESQIKLQDQYRKVRDTVKVKREELTTDMQRWQASSERWMHDFTRKFVGQFEKIIPGRKRPRRLTHDSEGSSSQITASSSSSSSSFSPSSPSSPSSSTE